MKNSIYIFILVMFSNGITAQNVDFNLIKFNGLSLNSPKELIIKEMGEPEKIFEPNYECGALSSDTQNKKFYTLQYSNVKFTGNEDEDYYIDYLKFEDNSPVVLKYGHYDLNCETGLSLLAVIFGKEVIEDFEEDPNGGIIILKKGGIDGIRLEIKDGKLLSFEYWTPC